MYIIFMAFNKIGLIFIHGDRSHGALGPPTKKKTLLCGFLSNYQGLCDFVCLSASVCLSACSRGGLLCGYVQLLVYSRPRLVSHEPRSVAGARLRKL